MTEPHMMSLYELREWIDEEPEAWSPDRIRRLARAAAIERGINEADFAASLLEALEDAHAERAEPDPVRQEPCPACAGRGIDNGTYCRTCFGRGKVWVRVDGA